MQKLNKTNTTFITFPFKFNSKELKNAPICGMSLRAAGSMRFRWNEKNQIRDDFFKSLSKEKTFVPVELIHSHIVYDISNKNDTFLLQGDGIITKNTNLIPTVTVADCMPIFIYEQNSKVFGIVHSGWKGTGIVVDAINLACKNYNSKPENFCVILGPHIRNCCYIVTEERADFFAKNFGDDCVELLENKDEFFHEKTFLCNWNYGNGKLFKLSLEKANLFALKKIGVKSENINIIKECTCCNEKFGSNRRETAFSNKQDAFTVQAAFINLQKD